MAIMARGGVIGVGGAEVRGRGDKFALQTDTSRKVIHKFTFSLSTNSYQDCLLTSAAVLEILGLALCR
jgi:hypothetical protein